MSIKQQLAGFLRRSGFIKVVDKCLFYFHRTRNYFDNTRFSKSNVGFDFPPDYFLYESYRLNYRDYFEDGPATATDLVTLIRKHTPVEALKWLDWGCGPGRVVRHLPGLLGTSSIVFGTDYNHTYIDWCRKHIPQVQFRINAIDPPLNFENGAFNVVTGLSILTHLSEEKHLSWITELHRVTNKGAIVLLTTQGKHFRRKLLPGEKNIFDAGKLVTRERVSEGHRLFSSFQPPEFMKSLLIPGFTILEWLEGSDEKGAIMEQDIWVVKKN